MRAWKRALSSCSLLKEFPAPGARTSNGLEYLRSQVSGYSDAANYMDAPAVRDRGLITASGLADVEFARELLEELDVLSAEDRAVWTALFRSARLPEGT